MLFGLDLENWKESKLTFCTIVFGQSTSLLKNVAVSCSNFSKINLQFLVLLSLSPLYILTFWQFKVKFSNVSSQGKIIPWRRF